jgi:hypothetical protein
VESQFLCYIIFYFFTFFSQLSPIILPQFFETCFKLKEFENFEKIRIFGPRVLKNPKIEEYNNRFEYAKLPSILRNNNKVTRTLSPISMNKVSNNIF